MRIWRLISKLIKNSSHFVYHNKCLVSGSARGMSSTSTKGWKVTRRLLLAFVNEAIGAAVMMNSRTDMCWLMVRFLCAVNLNCQVVCSANHPVFAEFVGCSLPVPRPQC